MRPQNIFLSPPSRETLAKVFRQNAPASPYPKFGDARWAEIFARPRLAPVIACVVRQASAPAERDAPLPPLTDALYRQFAATGVRLPFENIYFERRRHLARAALTLLAAPASARDPDPDKNPALRSLASKMEQTLAEDSWTLPAHAPESPSGRDPRRVDLFAAETASHLADLLHVFGEILPKKLRAGIRAKLRRDIFENYLTGGEFFWWTQQRNNWNAVCHQGIVGAALAVEDDAGLLAALVAKASKHLPAFVDAFGDDGACSEGPAYWEYGFGAFSLLNEQLEKRSRGALSLFANNPKIARIAACGPAMSLSNGRVVNFADCAAETVLRASTLHYLADKFDSAACRQQAALNYALLTRPENTNAPFYESPRTDFLFYLHFFLHAPGDAEIAAAFTPSPPSAVAAARVDVLPTLGIQVARGRDTSGNLWESAAKGGNNAEEHNHNDVGNFLLNLNGRPVVAEIGRPEYTGAYFQKDTRYTFFAARSLGHSLPLINGCEQDAGAEHTAKILRADTAPDASGRILFEADLTDAWPVEAGLKRFVRRLVPNPSAGIFRWEDIIELRAPGNVESGFITGCEAIEILTPLHLVITDGRQKIHFRLITETTAENSNVLKWTHVDAHDCAMLDGRIQTWRRIVLAPARNAPLAARYHAEVEISLRPD
ncbi:heparinase [Opitutaceae bacterium TAV4]|uniref:heparinase II/III domain-containing protein n=1 Tax=Geminisphaera colitermitum TaxID=1148786 RepID=UPI000158D14C|nr:heparinase II/III family protein [Geminisphaera colitermitum]RRJ94650.1 heparinase [Opitutaceae bacterium TAV4]RRJ98718.1 heparinase [Opitutaceae bacterium TAV3]